MTFDECVAGLVVAWAKYTWLFGEAPHGTEKQMRALLELMPNKDLFEAEAPE